MQNISTTAPGRRPKLLVIELWGLGDLALAIPFLRAASQYAEVTLLAKPLAAPLVRRFCPSVQLMPFEAPWTRFRQKYDFKHWPWRKMREAIRTLRATHYDAAVSVRPDPRDHALAALVGASLRAGFPKRGSQLLLTDTVRSRGDHRADYWKALADHFGWPLPSQSIRPRTGRKIVIHTGAAQPVREWPRERFEILGRELAANGWEIDWIDNSLTDLHTLLDRLERADRFIGNDSGPGHLAALCGVPTFTIFGPQLPELFAPTHSGSKWIEGAPCTYKPCYDTCRFGSPHCIREIGAPVATRRVLDWLAALT